MSGKMSGMRLWRGGGRGTRRGEAAWRGNGEGGDGDVAWMG